jgi:hypothetical protein
MPELRLVKVIVQPVFILDHGTHVTEVEHPPVVIPAEEWPTYSSERFVREVQDWQRRIDAEQAAVTEGPSDDDAATPPTN